MVVKTSLSFDELESEVPTGRGWCQAGYKGAFLAFDLELKERGGGGGVDLHAILVKQCQILGDNTYPYLLHRAHEAAVVTMAEKEQVTQMITLELRRRKLEVGQVSQKQIAKNSAKRGRYQ